jgi:hypothetical protein
MIDHLKPLLESGLINEETREAIQEAWQGKLQEAREEIQSDMREEFAQRYEHDKSVMVEALDRMVTEKLSEEIKQVQEEKALLQKERAESMNVMRENAQKFNDFMITKLAEEMGEFRNDSKIRSEGIQKLESFVMEALAREIQEFAQDKRALVQAKVKLVAEAREQLTNLKKRFVSESAQKLSKKVTGHLKSELTQLHEDIRSARENNFGRRIFEAFATEFGATHLNEKAEIRNLMNAMKEKEKELNEARAQVQQKQALAESKERELRKVRENNQREKIMDELISPLNAEKGAVMRDLLESVQTSRLKSTYEKYLPAVLSEATTSTKRVISESRTEVTGDKSAKVVIEDSGVNSNIIEIKRLAGLK